MTGRPDGAAAHARGPDRDTGVRANGVGAIGSAARRSLLVAALAASLVAGCAGTPSPTSASAPTPAPEVRRALAPTGALRVGLYTGSPSSVVGDPSTVAPGDEARGVGYDLGRALALRLGVPFVPVVFPGNAQALAAVRSGAVDVTFTNATPARARDMDFSPPFLDVEKSFLVPAGSSLESLSDLGRPGLRIGVSDGSSTAAELAPGYPASTLVGVPTLKQAIDMLRDGRIDAFATNKAILYELSDALPASVVLPGHWGMEHFAAGIPKGRGGRAFVDAFVVDAQRDGTVERAVRRAGLRGSVAPAP